MRVAVQYKADNVLKQGLAEARRARLISGLEPAVKLHNSGKP